ncbi:MAG TPA: FHA domain-containing protein [Pirellulaceae bacterium]|nr:FHA domain-containing protein [Pirellulaceae bacterium]
MDAPILRFDRYIPPEAHILPLGPRVALEITRGRVRQRIRPVRGRMFLIGTANDCDLVLGDLSFPEAYAYLFVQNSKITIRRLGTGPELVICGEAVESAELLDGDHVAFGPFELRVVIDDSPRQRTAIHAAAGCSHAATAADSSAEVASYDLDSPSFTD